MDTDSFGRGANGKASAGARADRRRLALVISHLGAGGAQRVIVSLANHWARAGHGVTLMTLGESDTESFFALHRDVERRHVDVDWSKRNVTKGMNTLKQVSALRRALQETRPDVVVSFIAKANILALLASWGLGVPVIVSDRLDPGAHPLDRARKVFRRLLYPRAATVVLQTQAALRFYPRAIRRRVQVVPNPVRLPPPDDANLPRRDRRDAKVLVALGRLHEQKGFDLLLQAFGAVRQRHPDWRLDIWGEGAERPKLERLVSDLRLEEWVRLPGLTKVPYEVLKSADLFVMSSRREGFPNALCEAMACGLPVISFDCPSGPSEIIRHGVDGILVTPEDVHALANAMSGLMADDAECDRLASRAPEVIQRFSESAVLSQWDAIVADADAAGR